MLRDVVEIRPQRWLSECRFVSVKLGLELAGGGEREHGGDRGGEARGRVAAALKVGAHEAVAERLGGHVSGLLERARAVHALQALAVRAVARADGVDVRAGVGRALANFRAASGELVAVSGAAFFAGGRRGKSVADHCVCCLE